MTKIGALFLGLLLCNGLHAQNEGPIVASMIKLVSDPEIFDSHRILVRGYLKYDLNLFLYPTKEQAVFKDHGSSLLVGNNIVGESDIGRLCGENNVQITGTLERSSTWVAPGRWLHLYELGAIEEVSILADAGRKETCYAR